MFGSLIFSIIIWGIGMLILYFVIETAVKNGINNSVVGQRFSRKNGDAENKKSFLDSDLDNNQ